jgi:glycine cleavage system H protein
MIIPAELKYTKSDEWVKVEGKTALIGITDYAQGQLSDIVYVGYNFEKDQPIKPGDSLVTVESVKAAAEVISPLTGKVIETNLSLSSSPEVINDDPYVKGWMYKVEFNDLKEFEMLMDSKTYEKYCKTRGH